LRRIQIPPNRLSTWKATAWKAGTVLGIALLVAVVVAFSNQPPNEPLTGAIRVGSYIASPFDSIPIYVNISDAAVVGTVQSRTGMHREDEWHGYYYVTLGVERVLKGSVAGSIVVKILQLPEHRGEHTRPNLSVGERVFLFLFSTDDPAADFETGFEDKIWRIDGCKVYNRWGRSMRQSEEARRVTPPERLERWGRTFSLHKFLRLVKKAIAGKTSGIWKPVSRDAEAIYKWSLFILAAVIIILLAIGILAIYYKRVTKDPDRLG